MGYDTSSHTNGVTQTNGVADSNGVSRDGLHVLVVGAGIGGLTAALALRQTGHHVEVFEQSQFASEVGAAVHLAPNSNGVLRRLGIYAEEFGSVRMEHLREYSSQGQLLRQMDLEEANKMWQHPWHLAHRIHLHSNLKRAVVSKDGLGKPVELHTASRVKAVDEETATITLEDGRTIQGDVILGADGVHSVTRRSIDPDAKPFSSGKSAFRFLVSREVVASDSATKGFVEDDGGLVIWYGVDRRIVMYPTSDNKLLNFVCIHPEDESDGSADWNKDGSLDHMLKIFEGFGSAVTTLLSKADPETVKVWKLLDCHEMPKWTKARLALLGDAAHPFLPHQGQGAGAAIEDAAALATVLPSDTPKDLIPERLRLYDTIRHERATKIQEFSRMIGSDDKDKKGLDMTQFTNYNFGHDEFDNSAQRFREYQWAKTPKQYWRMPLGFGPMPGPRQTHLGQPRDSVNSTFTTASIRFKTSRTALQNLFPPGRSGYSFKSPGTVAYASFAQTTLNKMEWLGGSGYSHLGLYIHGVQYTKPDGSVINGTYMPILFESLTDPIVSGREELGMPKLYTAIEIFRRAESYHIKTGWQGANWGNFSLRGLKQVDPKAEQGTISGEPDDGVIVHRYIPATGKDNKGKSEADYACFVPFAEDTPAPSAQRVWKADKAVFDIDGMDWDCLPTLHHIISRLADIPVYEVLGGKVVEGVGVPDVSNARPA